MKTLKEEWDEKKQEAKDSISQYNINPTSTAKEMCDICHTFVAGPGGLCYNCEEKMRRITEEPSSPITGKSALDNQVAGDHYKCMAIQPIEFIQKNELNYCEAGAIKYVCRHRRKNGAEDIKKAIHLLELLLELEYSGRE